MFKDIRVHKVLTVIAVFLTIAVNILAVTLPLNGKDTGELSDAIPSFFVPAGYVFSIWSLIYLGLIGFAFYQASEKKTNWLLPVYPWFYLASMANIVWIFLWHYEYVAVSVIAMLTLLVSLIMIYTKLKIGVKKVSNKTKWLVNIPFSIYLGWISVATIANISAALVIANWDAFGLAPQFWSAIMIGVAASLTILMINIRKDWAYALVILWAFVGIGVKFPNEEYIIGALTAAILLIITSLIYRFVLVKKK